MIGRINRLFGRVGDSSKEVSWLLFRVTCCAMFMTHGFPKLFGANSQPPTGGGMTTVNIADLIVFSMPLEINALFVAGVVELFGGALILIGLWTQLIALIAVIIMVFAYLTAHLAWFPTLNNGELATLYALAYLLLFAFGPGQYSLDTWLEVRRQEKKGEKTAADLLGS